MRLRSGYDFILFAPGFGLTWVARSAYAFTTAAIDALDSTRNKEVSNG